MTKLKDFMTDSFIDDFCLNIIKIFEGSKQHKFVVRDISEIRKFTHSLFDEFTFKAEEIVLKKDEDPVKHFNKLMDRLVEKVIAMINFLMIYKMEEMRLHSRIEELEKRIKDGI